MLTEEQKIRYERQIREFGENAQEQLLTKKVVQVGAGGLGSPLGYYLTAAGIGNLTIIDYDTISLSNLNRQILYNTDDVGKSKAKLAAEKLKRLNPDVNIQSFDVKLNGDNFKEYFKDVDYIVDASDNMPTKFLMNDIGLNLNIPFTIAGVQGLEGQIISVDPHKTACYRCVFGGPHSDIHTKEDEEYTRIEKEKRKVTLGILGYNAGCFGSLEAAEVVKGLLGMETRLLNTLLMADLNTMKFMSIKVVKREDCLCAHSL